MASKGEKVSKSEVSAAYKEFADAFEPYETTKKPPSLVVFTDSKSAARFCECHIRASKLVALATTDVPLDPEQPDYRANRELVTNHAAFAQMKEDAVAGRAFSNIVAEYTKDYDPEHPLKIIGGQHRFEAIKVGLAAGIDQYHGVKVYLDLNMDQRLDVQLISNTNIAISSDLYDRMQETFKGPELREWCQTVGLLDPGKDFADRGGRGRPFSVQAARTFIVNFYKGKSIDAKNNFDVSDTTPTLCPSGEDDAEWNAIRQQANLWKDPGLITAAKEFASLVKAQRKAFSGKSGIPIDYPEKTLNGAVMAAWVYVAGMLQANNVRLQRHFSLAKTAGRDPLNAAALAKGRHRSDPPNYRGLGYRTDTRERGRLVELFYLQSENGGGITKNSIDIAIAKYHAKLALLDVKKAEAKG